MHKTCPLRYLYNVQPMWRAQVVELSTTCRYFWVKVYNTSLIFVCKKNLKYSSNLCFTQISTSLIFVWEKDSSSKQPDRVVGSEVKVAAGGLVAGREYNGEPSIHHLHYISHFRVNSEYTKYICRKVNVKKRWKWLLLLLALWVGLVAGREYNGEPSIHHLPYIYGIYPTLEWI